MAVGDVTAVEGCTDVYQVDTGMFDVPDYGSVYVVDAEHPAVVDTGLGADRQRVFDALDAVGVDRADLRAVVLTHVHLDHAGGAGFLAEACPNAGVYVHEVGAPHVVDPDALVAGTKRAVGDQWRYYADPRPVPADRVVELTGGDAVDLGDRTLTAHHAPGHAPHQVVYHDDRDDAVFTGDAAGIWVDELGWARETSPPPNFDLGQCLDDVETIRALAPDHLLYAHFGRATGDPDEVLATYARTLSTWVARVAAVDRDSADGAIEALGYEDAAAVWGPEKARAETRLNVDGVRHYLDTLEP